VYICSAFWPCSANIFERCALLAGVHYFGELHTNEFNPYIHSFFWCNLKIHLLLNISLALTSKDI
jgi:hypothetical protein